MMTYPCRLAVTTFRLNVSCIVSSRLRLLSACIVSLILILIAIAIPSARLCLMVDYLCVLAQFGADFGETVLSVNLRAIEVQPILFKGDSLNICCSATIGKGHIDTSALQCHFQLLPVLTSRNYSLQCIVYLILHGIGSTQPLAVNMVFTLCHVQPVLTGEFLAYLGVPHPVVLVRDKMTVVVNAVENDVAVRMLAIKVAHKDVLSVLDVHLSHVIVGDLLHQIVINLVNILF